MGTVFTRWRYVMRAFFLFKKNLGHLGQIVWLARGICTSGPKKTYECLHLPVGTFKKKHIWPGLSLGIHNANPMKWNEEKLLVIVLYCGVRYQMHTQRGYYLSWSDLVSSTVDTTQVTMKCTMPYWLCVENHKRLCSEVYFLWESRNNFNYVWHYLILVCLRTNKYKIL